MLLIDRSHIVFSMRPDNAPAATADSGDTVIFQTLDCFGGALCEDSDCFPGLDWDRINPSTGPLFVRGAMPGETLKVEILQIQTADRGVIASASNMGVFGSSCPGEAVRVYPITDGAVRFSEHVQLPLEPMIGVIGTAPASGAVPTGTPGPHGGNMDCRRIVAGSVVYLPVNVEGALLAMGDLHAVMGDGELCSCGLEVAGEVTVRVEVLKGATLSLPFLHHPDSVMTVFSAAGLDEAAKGASVQMHRFVTEQLGLPAHEAAIFLSCVADIRICQMVDPLVTCRVELPTRILADSGYTLP